MSVLESDVTIEGYTYDQFKEPKDRDKYNKFLAEEVFDYLWGFEVSLNDTFGYALGMCEYIYADDWMDLDPLVQDFGHDAIHAYFALMLDADVIKPLQNKNYFKCKKIIRTLKDEHGLFDWFEYGKSHTERKFMHSINAKRRKELLEEVLQQFGDTDIEVIEKIKKHLNGTKKDN